MKRFWKFLFRGCLILLAIPVVFIVFVICKTEFDRAKLAKLKNTLDYYTDDYTITNNTEDPKFKLLVEEFKKQEHRFEFDTCEYKYNNQSFFLGASQTEIINIFGKPDEQNERLLYEFNDRSRYFGKSEDDKKEIAELTREYGDSLKLTNRFISYKYNSLKLSLRFEYINNSFKLYSFGIGLSEFNNSNYKFEHEDTVFDVILFRQAPYQLDMSVNDFMEMSDLSHEKLRRFRRSFFMFQKECPITKDTRIFIDIDSRAIYKQEGGGHMTWTGDFDPNTSYPIEGLSFYAQTLEEYLD